MPCKNTAGFVGLTVVTYISGTSKEPVSKPASSKTHCVLVNQKQVCYLLILQSAHYSTSDFIIHFFVCNEILIQFCNEVLSIWLFLLIIIFVHSFKYIFYDRYLICRQIDSTDPVQIAVSNRLYIDTLNYE